jgi:hypothetical protein
MRSERTLSVLALTMPSFWTTGGTRTLPFAFFVHFPFPTVCGTFRLTERLPLLVCRYIITQNVCVRPRTCATIRRKANLEQAVRQPFSLPDQWDTDRASSQDRIDP